MVAFLLPLAVAIVVDIIAACLDGAHTPLMGAALFAEYEDVLGRSGLFARSRLSVRERSELFDIFVARCEWTRVYFGWRPNLRYEADNHLVESQAVRAISSRVTSVTWRGWS